MASKVIVVGALNGRFSEVFPKLAGLHTKQSFACAIIVGDLFGPSPPEQGIQQLLQGEIKVALPTYFTLGSSALPPPVLERILKSDGEVCENLFFLGKKGVLNTSEGLRIVTLGGQLDGGIVASSTASEPGEIKASPFYTIADAAGLRGANYADFLLTHDWPLGVEEGSSVSLPEQRPSGSQAIADLARALRPRYHFCSGDGFFYEREPYRNGLRDKETVADRRVTRFLALASFGNAAKQKAMYAFSINPSELQTDTVGSTPCPYPDTSGSRKRTTPDSNSGNVFFAGEERRSYGHRKKHRHDPRPPPGPDSCFFCLSYPQLEKHLIVSIGSEVYLTTAKGPLTSPTINPPELPFSSHILIIPLAHSPTLQSIDDPETKTNTIAEMDRYRVAIESMLSEHSCGAVTFEVRRSSGIHIHWQVVPVQKAKLGQVDDAFDAADRRFVGAGEVKDEEDAFWYRVSGREKGRALKLGQDEYFDLQFGRRVLAGVVGARKVHWKDCILPFEEEAKDAEAFKGAFKSYDFSLE